MFDGGVVSDDLYAILGVPSTASDQEIRRAYRVLARRYHPDLSSHDKSGERFKKIAEAYDVLSDPKKREKYDASKQSGGGNGPRFTQTGSRTSARERYERAARAMGALRSGTSPRPASEVSSLEHGAKGFWADLKRLTTRLFAHDQRARHHSPHRLSVIEVSVSVPDAVRGVRKTVEIEDEGEIRKISVTIPPGVRQGSVVRLRAKGASNEELVLITRIAPHPFLALTPRGLLVDLPITVKEALYGATIQVPTLEEPVLLKIPPNSQSGNELRLKERGVSLRDGSRGDLLFRLLIQIPTHPEAPGLRDLIDALDRYSAAPPREELLKLRSLLG